MANYREPTKRRRVEVPIPSDRSPKQRRATQRPSPQNIYNKKGPLINAGIVAITTVLTTVLLLLISGQIRDTTDASLIAQSTSPLAGGLFTTQPTPKPFMTPTPSAQSTRSAATPSPETETTSPADTPDDTEIQAALDQKLGDDASLSALGITATVTDGKVILVGTAPSDQMKGKVEKLVRSIKGVKQIDNQIVVISNL